MHPSSEGLVENTANRGARVRPTTLAELRDLMETRREVETWCLTRSIIRSGAEWEAEILRSLHLLTRARLPTSAEDRASAEDWHNLTAAFTCHLWLRAVLEHAGRSFRRVAQAASAELSLACR